MSANDWILWNYVLFGLSGAIWITVLVPIQFRPAQILRLSSTQEVPPAYFRRARIWSLAGIVATLAPLPAVYWMVAKNL